jgi:hypothetical protein
MVPRRSGKTAALRAQQSSVRPWRGHEEHEDGEKGAREESNRAGHDDEVTRRVSLAAAVMGGTIPRAT